MTSGSDQPPFADAHAADFSENDESAYALIGELLSVPDATGTPSYHLLVGQDLTRPIDSDYVPLLQFFATPRAQHQAEEWLKWAEAPPGFLNHLVKHGFLVRVDPRTPTAAAKSFRGLRLSAQSEPGPTTDLGLVSLMSQGSEQPSTYVSVELAAVLWGNEQGYDIPTAIKKIAKSSGLERDLVTRRVLALMPTLLEYRYARLEWLHVPNT